MPDLTRKPLQEAENILKTLGVQYITEVVPGSDDIPPGHVVATDPPAGAKIVPGATIVKIKVKQNPSPPPANNPPLPENNQPPPENNQPPPTNNPPTAPPTPQMSAPVAPTAQTPESGSGSGGGSDGSGGGSGGSGGTP